jgi:hypothetical protein
MARHKNNTSFLFTAKGGVKVECYENGGILNFKVRRPL